MDVYRSLHELGAELHGAALAVGNFDGVHLGHRSLLEHARRLARARGARAAALTFEPHPTRVLAPELAPPRITTLPRKLALLEQAGLDAVVLVPFDHAFARTTPEAFATEILAGAVGAKDVVVGPDFAFGKGRAGDGAHLRALLNGLAEVHVLPAIGVDGHRVSSSKIRELVLTGRVAPAARLLGRPHLLDGVVVRGEGRGRTIGIPTANVAPETELVPSIGVYAVRARGPGLDGAVAGAANIGRKPTFGGNAVTIEVHLFDVEVDLYGRSLEVEFVERLRGEQKFESVEALLGQIRRDLGAARAILGVPA